MKNLNNILVLFVAIFFMFSGCSSSSDSSLSTENNVTIDSATLDGVAQKGPFLEGSSVVVYKIGDDFERTKDSVETTTDATGHYNISVPWEGLSELEVSGYYYDEITGEKSLDEITINSYVMVEKGELSTNVNIFTYLHEYKH
ncbi:MAG: hypothetical protein OQK11_00720, partial [Thiovulaceae bacterium]|nr:hypothetical protein [Sulfurimonadaceae bacterium]